MTVGKRVLAIGGKERNPDKHLDSIEEYDTDTGYTYDSQTLPYNNISKI